MSIQKIESQGVKIEVENAKSLITLSIKKIFNTLRVLKIYSGLNETQIVNTREQIDHILF